METPDHLLEVLNELGPTWIRQFERQPRLSVFFSVSGTGILMLNDEEVCPVEDVDLSTIFVDVESFGFFTQTGEEIRFYVDWPYVGPPRLLPWLKVL